MARMLASRFPCDRRTPFGCPVLPDVYWMRAGSSWVAARGCPGSPGSTSAPATDSSDATCRVNKPANRSTSRNVTSRRAPALRRMAVWRRAYSAIRSARNGGYSGTGTHPAISVPMKVGKKRCSVRSMMATASPRRSPRAAMPDATFDASSHSQA